jgi:hypothetical protein
MFHLAFVLLSASVTIACPFLCRGDLGGAETHSGQESNCSCCDRAFPGERSDPDQPQPSAPSEDCGCGDCLCQGAVVEPSAGFPTGSVDIAVTAILLSPEAGGQEPGKGLGPAWRTLPGGLLPAGRDARILHQSFLF